MTIYTTTVVQAATVFDFDVESTNLYVAETGGIFSTGANATVYSTEGYSRVVVQGEIGSDVHIAVFLLGGNSSVSVGHNGQIGSASSQGIQMRGSENVVNNAGSIIGTWGVYVYGNDTTVNNSGHIWGTTSGDNDYIESGIFMVDRDNDSMNSDFFINNSGIVSGHDYAIYAGEVAFYTYYASNTSVNNSGTLMGGGFGAVFLGLGEDTLVNSGHIIGDVFMGGDNDVFDGRLGMVDGDVLGGAGDDTYVVDSDALSLVENASEGLDTVESFASFTLANNFENLVLRGSEDLNGFGNAADNTIAGNAGDNTLIGRGGVDTLNGDDGNDMMRGGAGEDVLNGGDGDDQLRGQSGNDTLNGDEGNDILFGGAGIDQMNGGDGDDVLVSGAGGDNMRGEAGGDTFRFLRASDSPDLGLGPRTDRIYDFVQGEDVIDLQAVVPGTLDFIGSSAFSASGQAEVRVTDDGNSAREVRVDVDGDGTSDMWIRVLNISSLNEADFIL